MTPQQLIARAASQASVTEERAVHVHGATLRALLASGQVIRLTEVLSHPDQHVEVRRFRYGHVLGPGATRASIAEWQALHPSICLNPEIVEFLTLVDGIHLWADLDQSRAYYGICPLSEWTELALSDWQFLFDEFDKPKPGAAVISYHDNGDYFLVLDTLENCFTWYDPQDFPSTRTVKRSVNELLEWWWELAQELAPNGNAAGQQRLADEHLASLGTRR